MQRKGGLLRLKKRAPDSSAVEEPSKKHAPHQEFRPLASVSASTSQLLCSLLLKNIPKTLPPLPPSQMVKRSAVTSDPELQDSPDALEVKDKRKMWTPLPPPNMGLLTKRNPVILSLEQLCDLASEPADPTSSTTPPLSTIGGEYLSMCDKSGCHNMPHPISSEAVEASKISDNNSADALEVEGWDESDVDLFDGEELDVVWRNVDLTVDSSGDSSDGLPAVNLGGNQEPSGTSRDWHKASDEQYKLKSPNRTPSSGSHMTLSSLVTGHDIVLKQEDRPTFGGRKFPPKTTAGKHSSTGPNQTLTDPRQQLKLSTSSEPLGQDFKPAGAKRASYPSRGNSSRGRHDSALRPPLVTENCPMCGTAFPHEYNQLDADHHIALCLERELLLEDVVMLD